MIDEFGTLDLRGVVEIKEDKNNLKIKKIIIGNTLEKIGKGSFYRCFNLEEIEFEEECKATFHKVASKHLKICC